MFKYLWKSSDLNVWINIMIIAFELKVYTLLTSLFLPPAHEIPQTLTFVMSNSAQISKVFLVLNVVREICQEVV